MGCPDFELAGLYATVRVVDLRSNTGCAAAEVLAREVLSHDDCVEESPSGTSDCTAQAFLCRSELQPREGITFGVVCEAGTRRVSFNLEESAAPELPGQPVEFAVCQEFPDWKPPGTVQEQQSFLDATGNPRYSGSPADTLESALAEPFFDTGGGASASADYYYLSGIWTLDPSGPGAIDFGSCATSSVPGQTQIWLKRNHAVAVSLNKGEALIQAEPTDSGIEVVEFPNPDFAPVELRGEEPAWP